MSTKKALLPTPATSPERGTQTLISASRSDPLARAIDVPPPIAAAATIAPAINLRVVFMVAPVGGFLVVEVLRQQVRRATPIGSRQAAVNVIWCPKSPVLSRFRQQSCSWKGSVTRWRWRHSLYVVGAI